MQAHRAEENHNAQDVGISLRIWIYSDDYIKKEESHKNEVNIHQDMTGMVLHESSEKVCEVKNKE